MALFQFSTSINTTVSELAEKLISWQEDGASISDITISSVNDITLLINDNKFEDNSIYTTIICHYLQMLIIIGFYVILLDMRL